ncbi:hypothetical protein [Candidatus Pseudomonas adelgestsugas]|nr:hypothetical protein [Candidatus Pseudomonas adelgestsugas]
MTNILYGLPKSNLDNLTMVLNSLLYLVYLLGTASLVAAPAITCSDHQKL